MSDDLKGSGFIARMGGKSKIAKQIINLFPDDYTELRYIEPFVGGGSVFFKKEPSKEEIINDLDKNVILCYRGLKKYSVEKIKESFKTYVVSKDNFYDLKDSRPTDAYLKFIRQMLLFKYSYFGKGDSAVIERKIIGDFTKEKSRMKNVKIFSKDYIKIIHEFDSLNSFFYLDPPYENSDKLYVHDYVSINELYDVLKHVRGKWLLSYNYSKDVVKLFKGYNINTISTIYEKFKDGRRIPTKIKELIISNY